MSNLAGSANAPSLKQMPEELERREIEGTPDLPVRR